MWIELALLLPLAGAKMLTREQVDRPTGAACDGFLQGGLESAAEIEDEIGTVHALDVSRSELDVVRLRTWRREVVDLDILAADLLRCPRERVEGRDDVRLVGRASIRATASGQREHQPQEQRPLHRVRA